MNDLILLASQRTLSFKVQRPERARPSDLQLRIGNHDRLTTIA